MRNVCDPSLCDFIRIVKQAMSPQTTPSSKPRWTQFHSSKLLSNHKMKSSTLMIILSIGMLLATAQSCLECGEECKRVCGTKQFKACCFNYLKKRSFPPSGPDLKTLDGNSQLEISLADAISRRSSGAESQASAPSQFDELLPVATLLAKQGRLVTLTQGRLQLVYDA